MEQQGVMGRCLPTTMIVVSYRRMGSRCDGDAAGYHDLNAHLMAALSPWAGDEDRVAIRLPRGMAMRCHFAILKLVPICRWRDTRVAALNMLVLWRCL